MKTFEEAFSEVPGWRKVVGLLMFISLVPSEQTIMDFMFGKGRWPS